jgi:hypothetical protein
MVGSRTMRALELETAERRDIAWQVAHETLSRLARERAAADAEEGRWLLAAQRSAVHVHLGYGAFSEHIQPLFGYKPRTTLDKLRVPEALEGLPALARALASGQISWSAARELTRVAIVAPRRRTGFPPRPFRPAPRAALRSDCRNSRALPRSHQ